MHTLYQPAKLVLLMLMLSATQLQAQPFPFTNPLPIPQRLTGNTFDLVVQDTVHNFDPTQSVDTANLNLAIPTYSYAAAGNPVSTYLGPTLVWTKGTTVSFNIENKLNGDSATAHWHGMNLPSEMDGGPHQSFQAGETWSPFFPVTDSVQTLWYHSHLMNFTTEQVIKGLAGMVIIEDPAGDPYYPIMPHDYGENDFPIIIQEKDFLFSNGTVTGMKVSEKPGNGPYTLINGVVNPVLHVPPQVIRLRLLNGSPRKAFQVGISTQRSDPIFFETLYLAGTDGGYTPEAFPMDSAFISVGERMELLVDLTGFANGDTLYLNNLVRSIPRDVITGPPFITGTPGDAFMAIVIDNSIQPADPVTNVPSTLKPYSVDTLDIFKHRTKQLMQVVVGGKKVWMIDSLPMNMMVLNDTILVNAKEMWRVENLTHISHPFHIHKVQFQVYQYIGNAGVDSVANPDTLTYPNLPPYLMGFKDDVLVRAGATMTFVARFDSFPDTTINFRNGFMYHCHILTHEDTSMMHQFTVVDSSTYFKYFGTTDLDNSFTSADLKIYPNPTSGILYLEGSIREPMELWISDITGRNLKRMQIAPFEGKKRIILDDIPPGWLLIQGTTGSAQVRARMLKR